MVGLVVLNAATQRPESRILSVALHGRPGCTECCHTEPESCIQSLYCHTEPESCIQSLYCHTEARIVHPVSILPHRARIVHPVSVLPHRGQNRASSLYTATQSQNRASCLWRCMVGRVVQNASCHPEGRIVNPVCGIAW